MTERRSQILDAALAVLADQGMRALTHRAVDAAAGIPAGSTSYYFRTRSALVAGCVERLVEIDATVDAPNLMAPGGEPAALAAVLARIVAARATIQRHLTVARYELTLAALRDAELHGVLRRGGDANRKVLANSLVSLGAADPATAAEEVMAALEGMIFTALVWGPHEHSALTESLRPAVERILKAQPGVA